ncbi:MAG TPA: DUF4331 family protein [Chloroflexota bacterium]|nr:DUF4331 family protein [Chloroflexota bacterium]
MADHLDAPGLQSPNMKAQIDITDIYAFQKPGDTNKSILILNVNPLAPTLATSFDSDAVYEIKIDTDADAVAEVAFRIGFSPVVHDTQTALVKIATGHQAAGANGGGAVLFRHAPVSLTKESTPQVVTQEDGFKFFAGMRSDPFFFDLAGFLAGFKFTGTDFFIDKNVFSIALEVPNSALGKNPRIGVWARILMPQNGQLVQIDRMGRPAINTVFNHGQDKNTFNHIEPSQDRTTLTVDPNPQAGVTFLQSFELTLESFGRSAEAAAEIAMILLPDILTYDYSSNAGFLNGRNLTDDVIDIELNLVTNGAVTTDMVGPHTDFMSSFPYLGTPH